MNCDEARQLLHAYLDNELDVPTTLHVEKHLEVCADCQKELDGAQSISRAVTQPAVYYPASAALRAKVRDAIRAGAGASSLPPLSTTNPRWWQRRSVLTGVAAALILMAGTAVLLSPPRQSQVQIVELLDSHLRSLEAHHLLDVESTDQHTVKPWFAGQIDYAPPVIDLAGEGFPLIGGRLDYLDQKKIAAIVYRRNKHIINLFISPGSGRHAVESKQGFNLIRFECKGMDCWAVSDLGLTDLQQFAELFAAQKAASTRF